MSWSFETDADCQRELDRVDGFVRDEVEPLDHLLGNPWNIHDPRFRRLVRRRAAAQDKYAALLADLADDTLAH